MRARPCPSLVSRLVAVVVVVVASVPALLPGCGVEEPHAVLPFDEDTPEVDDHSNMLQRGVYDCTERDDTGYTAGTPFPIRVVTVDARPVEVATANAYLALQQAADDDGVAVRIVSGFRTMAQQEYLYGCYVNCSCNNCNLAARPGYSNHQSGHALDLNTSDAGVLTWLNAHADEFGFARTVSSEPWHWEWWGDATDYAGPCGTSSIPPGCASGSFEGTYCDDDGTAVESAHECLVGLGVDARCDDIEGHPAMCGTDTATRAEAVFMLGAAASMPLDGHADAFVDDDGHPLESWLDAARAYNVLLGDGQGHANPDGDATRSTIAILLVRMYALPQATRDWFSDDDGTANEDFHNRLAEAGFSAGCGAGDGGRNRFCGADRATRSTVARFACGIADKALTPVWAVADVDAGTPDDDDAGTADAGTDPENAPDDDPVDDPGVIDAPPEDEVAPRVFAPSVEEGCAQAPAAWGPGLAALALLRRRRRASGLRADVQADARAR